MKTIPASKIKQLLQESGVVYTYNEAGRLVREDFYKLKADGSKYFWGYREYIYDTNGNLTEKTPIREV